MTLPFLSRTGSDPRSRATRDQEGVRVMSETYAHLYRLPPDRLMFSPLRPLGLPDMAICSYQSIFAV